MFSRLTRSFKGSDDTLVSGGRGPVATLQDLLGEYQDVQSQTCHSEAGPGRERHKKRRSRKLSRLFGSDQEEEKTSVVSDNPGIYGRSLSMATLTPPSQKLGMLASSKDKRLDRVQHRMENIQKSLSMQGLAEDDTETVERLRRELQRKEKAITQLRRQCEGGSEAVRTKIQEVEEKVVRRENYLRSMREEARRRLGTDSSTIEGQINAAEREYEVERIQLELLDLGQELLKLRSQAQYQSSPPTHPTTSLTSLLSNMETPCLVVCTKLSSTQVSSLVTRGEGGLEAGEGMGVLSVQGGDRVLEMAGHNVSLVPPSLWPGIKQGLPDSVPTVFLCRGRGSGGGELREDIALIQSRLERKLAEGRTVESELATVRKEREGVEGENTRLRHRVAFLEEHTRELQAGLKGVRDSLARTLDSGLASTLAQLEVLGEADRCSTATSGVYSAGEGESEGSSSPPGTVGTSRDPRRWSLGLPEVPPPGCQQQNRRRTIQPGAPPKPARQFLNLTDCPTGKSLGRSSSRVSSVSSLVRWPLRNKDRSASTVAVDRVGSRDMLV